MGKKKAKNKRKSELKIIFFIILVAAALFIISTYAWFSTQRDVSITNLEGSVEVAEGLEISLDALNWSNEIVLGDDFNIIDNAYSGHRNISPSELLPVSTLGLVSNTEMSDIKMIRGKVTNSKILSDIVFMDETEKNSEAATYPGYFAFDVFLKNSSKQYDTDDVLQLNHNSKLEISEDGNKDVGLQNTARVAFAKFGTGAPQGEIDGANTTRSGVADVMASQQDILEITGAVGGNTVPITDVAIWEPNSNDHVTYIVNNNNAITWDSTNAGKYATKTLANGKKGFDENTQMPTYALKETAATAKDVVIDDIYFWDETDTNPDDGDGAFSSYLQQQMTLQTTKTSTEDYTTLEGVKNLMSTSTTDKTKPVPFSIAPNSVIRIRIYLWLEGQDVDCINYASHGGGITVDIGLVKLEPEGPPKV